MFSSFLKNTKRFFEPITYEPKEGFKTAANSFLSSLYFDVLPTLCTPLLFASLNNGDIKHIFFLALYVVGFLLLAFLIRYFIMPGWFWYGPLKIRGKMEEVYRKKILLKDNIIFESKGTGKIQSIVDRGIMTWSTSANEAVYYVVSTSTVFLLGVYMLFKMGVAYLTFFVVLIALSCYWYFYFKYKQYFIQLPEKEIQFEYNALQTRTLMSRQEIVFSEKIAKESKKLGELSRQAYIIKSKSDKPGVIAVNTLESIMTALPFVGVCIYVYTKGGNLTPVDIGVLTSFIVFSSRMSVMIWSFLSFVGRIMNDFPDIKKFWDFLDDTPDMIGYEEGNTFNHKTGSVEIKNVSFSYGEENIDVLNNFSLSVPGGTKLALVGRSGSGKTTIAKLITGYMRPTIGDIFIDGQNLKETALKTYYKHVGYLTQEPMVFDGTIRENLLYGAGDRTVSDEEIQNALQKAQCDFIFNTKEGLETQIGEKGIRLSGGERQRLAIAKLLLKNPEIVVLDEPTSALDSFSEEAVTRALDELFIGRTIIIIAHRLQTVKRADSIIVLEKGKIIEQGNHKELVEKNGEYAKMLEMQSGF